MFELAYRSIRRLSILDVTRLLHLGENECQTQQLHDGYVAAVLDASQLAELLRTDCISAQVGNPQSLSDGRCKVVAAMAGNRVVSFVWLARQAIAADDNYSRAAHLGTSIDLPNATAFVYNAWTDPDHRGKRLIAALLSHVVQHRIAGARSLLTSIDWTNQRSIRAFEFLGMRTVGTVIRIGRGKMQMSLVPDLGRLDLQIASDAPGWKLAI